MSNNLHETKEVRESKHGCRVVVVVIYVYMYMKAGQRQISRKNEKTEHKIRFLYFHLEIEKED